MSQIEEKKRREREVFVGFAKVCPLSIDVGSIENRDPPEPDIRCRLMDGGRIAFELTEIIDFDVARRHGEMPSAVDDFGRLVAKAADDSELKARFGDAVFRVMLHDPGVGFRSQRAVGALLAHLENPESHFRIGNHEFVRAPADPALWAVRSIGIGRGRPGGPHLVLQGGSDVSIPTAERVVDKLEHTYETDVPPELLAYVDRQPRVNDNVWVDAIAEVVRRGIDSSQFARCWVYDHKYGRILLTYSRDQSGKES